MEITTRRVSPDIYGRNVPIAETFEVAPIGVGTVFCLESNASSMVECLRQGTDGYPARLREERVKHISKYSGCDSRNWRNRLCIVRRKIDIWCTASNYLVSVIYRRCEAKHLATDRHDSVVTSNICKERGTGFRLGVPRAWSLVEN